MTTVETRLLNFYNIGGIRFQNIAANDTVITSKNNNPFNKKAPQNMWGFLYSIQHRLSVDDLFLMVDRFLVDRLEHF